MNIENQVCSLELAKKLKNLGVKQESIFSYMKKEDGRIFVTSSYGCNCWVELPYEAVDPIAAFTSAELAELLPNHVTTLTNEPFNNFRINISKFISVQENEAFNNFIINYWCDTTEVTGEIAFFTRKLTSNIYDINLANAMAKMLIYLLENKIMELYNG